MSLVYVCVYNSGCPTLIFLKGFNMEIIITVVVLVVIVAVIFRKSLAVWAKTAEDKSLSYSAKVRQKSNEDLLDVAKYLRETDLHSVKDIHRAFDKGDNSKFRAQTVESEEA